MSQKEYRYPASEYGFLRSDQKANVKIQKRLSYGVAILLSLFMCLICANWAFAWLSDHEFLINDLTLDEIEQKTFACIYKENDNLNLYIGKDPGFSDAHDTVAKYEDIEKEAEASSSAPWNSYASHIINIEIEQGVDPISTAHWFDECDRLENVTIPSTFLFSEKEDPFILAEPDPSKISDCDGYWYIDESDAGMSSVQVADLVNSRYGSESEPITVTSIAKPYAALYYNTVLVFGRGAPEPSWDDGAINLSSTYRNFESRSRPDWLTYYRTLNRVECAVEHPIPVKSLAQWFKDCYRLQDCDLSKLDTANVGALSYTFYGCSALRSLDISTWDVSNIASFNYSFYNCSSLEQLDMSAWKSDIAYDGRSPYLNSTFAGCSKLKEIDLSWTANWRVEASYLTNDPILYALNGCTNLDILKIPNIFIFNVADSKYLPSTPASNRNGYVNSNYWYVDNDEEPRSTFYAFSYVSDRSRANLSNGFKDTYVITLKTTRDFSKDVYAAVYGGDVLVIGKGMAPKAYAGKPLSCVYREIEKVAGGSLNSIPWYYSWNSKVTNAIINCDIAPRDCSHWFHGMNALDSITVNAVFNVSDSCASMFEGCMSLKSIDLAIFEMQDTDNLTSLFKDCAKLSDVRSDGWIGVTPVNLSHAFEGCTSLGYIDLSQLDSSNVQTYESMFAGCTQLNNPNLNNICIGEYASANCLMSMFDGCTSLEDIDLSTWNFGGMLQAYEDMDYRTQYGTFATMFRNCTSLRKLDLSSFVSPDWKDGMYWSPTFYPRGQNGTMGMLSGCSSLAEITVPSTFKFSREASDYNRTNYFFGFQRTSVPIEYSLVDKQIVRDEWYLDRKDYSNTYYADSRELNDHILGCYIWDRYDSGADPVTFRLGRIPKVDDAYAATYASQDRAEQRLVFSRVIGDGIPEYIEDMQLVNYGLGIEEDGYQRSWDKLNNASLYTSVVADGIISPKNMLSWFEGFSECLSFDLGKIDTENVSDLCRTFKDCHSVEMLDLSDWDTSNVLSFSSVYFAPYDRYPDRNNDGSNLSSACFSSMWALKDLNLSNWNFSSREYANTFNYGLSDRAIGFINNCPSLERIDLSDAVFPHANQFWYKCNALSEIILPANITAGSKGFVSPSEDYGTTANDKDGRWYKDANSAGLTGDEMAAYINEHPGEFSQNTKWVVGNKESYAAVYLNEDGTDGTLVFGRGFQKESLDGNKLYKAWTDIENRRVVQPNSFRSPFLDRATDNSANITEIRSGLYSYQAKITPSENNMYAYFSGFTKARSIDLSCFNSSNVTNIAYLFRQCMSLESINALDGFNVGKVRDMSGVFYLCQRMSNLDGIKNWNVSSVNNLSWMFCSCESIGAIDLSNWRISALNDVSNIFANCYSMASLKLPSSRMPLVNSYTTDIGSMFWQCRSLVDVDVSNWVTKNVVNMSSLFKGCSLLRELDVNLWDTSNVVDMGAMFNSCPVLSVDCSSWNVDKVEKKDDAVQGGFAYGSPGVIEPIWRLAESTSLSGATDLVGQDGILESEGDVQSGEGSTDKDSPVYVKDGPSAEEKAEGSGEEFVFDEDAKPLNGNTLDLKEARLANKWRIRQLRYAVNLFTKEVFPFSFLCQMRELAKKH